MANVSDLYKAAIAQHQAGRLTEAAELYRSALNLSPNHIDSLHKLAIIYDKTGQHGLATDLLSKVVAQSPACPMAHHNLGTILAKIGDHDRAIPAFRKEIALRPDFAPSYGGLAAAAITSGDLKTARSAITKAIELDPGNVWFRLFKSQTLADDQAVAELEAIDVESLPTDQQIALHFALGAAHETAGNFDKAFNHWLVGNGIKRRSVAYDEGGALEKVRQMSRMFTRRVLRGGQGNPSELPVFIVGMPRSGTSLVEQILSSHPAVYGSGELTVLPDLVADLPARIGAKARPADFYDLGTRYLDRIEKNALRVTDKAPSNFELLGHIQLSLPRAFIIHTVRDPVDTCLSCFITLFHTGNDNTYDLAELGRYYRAYRELMAHWHEVMPGRILDVRYEDVVADLEGQARRIIAHCGLEWDARCLEFYKTKRAVLTASVAQVRQPIYDKSIGRWRKYERFLGPLMAELGRPA